MRKARACLVGRAATGALVALAVLMTAGSAIAEGPGAPRSAATGATLLTVPMVASRYVPARATYSRFGVGAPRPYSVADYPIADLRAGWYWDWAARPDAERPLGTEYYPTIRLTQVGEDGFSFTPGIETIIEVAAVHPGTVWLIGNEPDRKYWQDDLVPRAYANAYAHLYRLIKDIDPTAVIGAGQIVQPTALRLQYLEEVLQAYRDAQGAEMPVDVWVIHAYPLSEDPLDNGADLPPGIDGGDIFRISLVETTSVAIFQKFIADFRQWMLDHGYRDCPLIVSEFGVLAYEDLCPDGVCLFDEEHVIQYMNATLEVLNSQANLETGYPADHYRLVQKWAWYSLTNSPTTGEGPLAGWLYDVDTRKRNPSGEAYARFAGSLPRTVNLRPVRLVGEYAVQDSVGGANALVLTAAVLNNGEVTAGGDVRVRFYLGDPDLGGTQIGSDQFIRGLAGGAIPRLVQVNWEDAPSGVWDVVVVVDPANVVAETDEQDNRLLGRVSVPAS